MREDHHLVVTIPVVEVPNRSMAEIRQRLLDGLLARWPESSPEGLAEFVRTVGVAPMAVMRPQPGDPLGTQFGVVLR